MEIVPVFISVDPERDTVEQIHDYVNGFLSIFLMKLKKKIYLPTLVFFHQSMLIANCTKNLNPIRSQVAT
jgi:SCO1/SenC